MPYRETLLPAPRHPSPNRPNKIYQTNPSFHSIPISQNHLQAFPRTHAKAIPRHVAISPVLRHSTQFHPQRLVAKFLICTDFPRTSPLADRLPSLLFYPRFCAFSRTGFRKDGSPCR
jgi:hypothetical protein